MLMAVFGRAVRYELIERNVIKLAAPVPKHKPKGPERNHTRALTDGEARRLLAFAHAEPLYNENGLDVADLVEIMLLTGVRIGEALAMRWLDVQLGQACACVRGWHDQADRRAGSDPAGRHQERRRYARCRPVAPCCAGADGSTVGDARPAGSGVPVGRRRVA